MNVEELTQKFPGGITVIPSDDGRAGVESNADRFIIFDTIEFRDDEGDIKAVAFNETLQKDIRFTIQDATPDGLGVFFTTADGPDFYIANFSLPQQEGGELANTETV